MATFQTTRSRNSELWFINNRRLQEAILGYYAKYTDRYEVKLYAVAIEGNHTQGPALFPKANRAHFMRDLNSSIARAIPRYCPEYKGGTFWARRYSAEYLSDSLDVEKQFFYTVLQAVQDGLVDKISDYPGYNCFHDAVYGVSKVYKIVNWSKYNEQRRWSSNVSIYDYIEEYTLTYTRLPGYEEMTLKEYAKMMHEKLEKYRQEVLANRNKPVLGKQKLISAKAGRIPKHSKTSTLDSHRPRVLSADNKAKKACEAWYYDIHFQYKEASLLYRRGNLTTVFPEGTYRPPLFTVACTVRNEDLRPA